MLLVLAFALVAAPAWAELYRWVDPEGVVHYTADLESIPPASRAAAQPGPHPRASAPPPPPPSPEAGSARPGGGAADRRRGRNGRPEPHAEAASEQRRAEHGE